MTFNQQLFDDVILFTCYSPSQSPAPPPSCWGWADCEPAAPSLPSLGRSWRIGSWGWPEQKSKEVEMKQLHESVGQTWLALTHQCGGCGDFRAAGCSNDHFHPVIFVKDDRRTHGRQRPLTCNAQSDCGCLIYQTSHDQAFASGQRVRLLWSALVNSKSNFYIQQYSTMK